MDCCFFNFDYCNFCKKIVNNDIYYYNINGKGKHQNKIICQDCIEFKILKGLSYKINNKN
jgi:superfamily II helicase